MSDFVKLMWMEFNAAKPPVGRDIEVENPSLEQILEGISKMDGAVRSYVMLFPSDQGGEVYLVIGGGNDGRFIVDHWDGIQGIEHHLIDPAITSEDRVDVIMAQPSSRPACEVVDLATAHKVATAYATTGKLAEDRHWKKT